MMIPAIYEIVVCDVLDEKWQAYFAPFLLTVRERQTVISGVIRDQAELFGLLLKLRDEGFSLVSVNPIDRQ